MSTKLLFIDRDGTLIVEPKDTHQVNGLAQMTFLPHVITALHNIIDVCDYKLIMVTNQDGLGTDDNPQDNFDLIQTKMLETFAGENVYFDKIHVDASYEKDHLPTRKPGIGMLLEYLTDEYDLKHSFVIGDRLTDVQLAHNLGCGSILIQDNGMPEDGQHQATICVSDWNEIYDFLTHQQRIVTEVRNTNETKIKITLNPDGSGKYNIHTGLGFFDHMLEQLARHGDMDLDIQVDGDLHIDEHHTIEDTAIALGTAFKKAVGDKMGMQRYGFTLPMDDCLAQVAIDFGGRSWLVWEATYQREKIGEMPTEMFYHFFKSFSDAALCNLNIKVEGTNEHHKIESTFKAFARTLKQAVARDLSKKTLPTTKGVI